MGTRIDWNLWQSFLAVAELGSLSAAARTLKLTQPTVGRHIDELETAIGKTLFLRSPQGLALTETARLMLPEAKAMQLASESVLRRASMVSHDHAGTVRVTASHVVGAEILPVALEGLLQRYPRLAIELAISNESADLLHNEADIAVRMVRPGQGTLIARKLCPVHIGLYAHKEYLERHGRPQSFEDLKDHLVIGPDRDQMGHAAFEAFQGVIVQSDIRLRTDSEAAHFAAIRSASAIGVMQKGIAFRDPLLEAVLENSISWTLESWLVVHDDLRDLPAIRLVFDHLAETLPAMLDPRR